MSEQLYATLGRKQAELEAMHTEYDRLLLLMEKVLSGEIEKSKVSVDLEKRSWSIT